MILRYNPGVNEESHALPAERAHPAAKLPWTIVIGSIGVFLGFMVGGWPRMNHDVAAVGLIAERMVGGERLYVDIPEVNPPLVFMLSSIVVRTSELIGMPWKELIVIATWAWVALGTCLVGWVCERGLLLDTSRARAALCLAIFTIHVSLVGADLGQREALFLAAFLPMLFAGAVAARGTPLPRPGVALIASFAALGIALKPFFVPFWLVAEAVFAFHSRRLGVILRLENMIVGGFLMAYGLYVVYLTPYLENLGDFLASYSAYDAPLNILVAQTMPTLLVALVGVIALWRGGLNRASVQPLDSALLLVTLPAVASVLFQAKGFSYHAWPLHALTMAGLLVIGLSQERHQAFIEASFLRTMGALGLAILLATAITGTWTSVQPMAFVMTAFALLSDGERGPLKLSPGLKDTAVRRERYWWLRLSTWLFPVCIVVLGASRSVASMVTSIRESLDQFQCAVMPYEQPPTHCSFSAFIGLLEPHVEPGDGVLWVSSDAVPSVILVMELQLRGVRSQSFMHVAGAYMRRDDPRTVHVYHDPAQAGEVESRVRESFVTSLARGEPRIVVFDRRAHGQAFGAVPFDTDLWFRADPAASAVLDSGYVLLPNAESVTRGTHVVYVRRE